MQFASLEDLNLSTDITPENIAISEEATTTENFIQETLAQLKETHESLEQIRPTNPLVQDLLITIGAASWDEFKTAYRTELEQLFPPTTPSPQPTTPPVHNPKITRLTQQQTTLKLKVATLNQKRTSLETQIRHMKEKLEQLNLTVAANELLTWDKPATEVVTKTKPLITHLETQFKAISAALPQLIKEITHSNRYLKIVESRLRIATTETPILTTNTGNPLVDAEITLAIAYRAASKIVALDEQIARIRMQIEKARTSLDTDGGVYDSVADKLTSFENQRALFIDVFTAAEDEYENASHYAPSDPLAYWPQWSELYTLIGKIRADRSIRSIEWQKQRQEAVKKLIDEDY